MIKKHKTTLILTSLLTLLPIPVGLLLWDRFPEKIATHWSITGQPDGWSSVPFSVFVMPLIMLAGQWLCVLASALDKKNQNQSKKIVRTVLWIIPVASNLCSAIMYALALGADFTISSVMVTAMGLMFVIIGNYLPKCKMNSTIGIKVPWAYSSDENWNATHRFGGRLWFIGGLGIILTAFLGDMGMVLMLIIMVALCIVPTVYSYRYYKLQQARGDVVSIPSAAAHSKAGKWSMVFAAVILVGVAIVMFSGNLDMQYGEDSFTIKASYYDDLTVNYDTIQAIEYREKNVSGVRVGGFGSLRLLMGYFQNEEFGTYIRYTYYEPEACVVLTAGEKILVISGEDAAETKAIYEALLARLS